MGEPPATVAPLIALVGSDGSGKSTVGDALLELARRHGPAELVHLGQQSGDLGRRIAGLPLVGRRLDKTITGRATQARDVKAKIPDPLTATIIYLFSLRRIRRFRRMLALRRQGVIVIADRYPQTAVPGILDGPGLGAAMASGPYVRWLAARERRLFEWMTAVLPDLVIRLNVDLPTAIARKPDHRVASLTRKVEAVPRLSFNGAPVLDLNSLDPLPDVLAQARAGAAPVLERWRASTTH